MSVLDRLDALEHAARHLEPDFETRDVQLQLIAAVRTLRAELIEAKRDLEGWDKGGYVIGGAESETDALITAAAPILTPSADPPPQSQAHDAHSPG